MITLDRYFVLILALTIVVPRLPLIPLGILGVVRADHLIILFTLPAIIFMVIKKNFYFIVALIFTLVFAVGHKTYASYAHQIGAVYSVLFIVQCIIFAQIGAKIALARDFKTLRIIYYALFFNISVGLLSRMTALKICSEYLNGDIQTSPCWLDEYGFSGAPYVFGSHVMGFMFMSLLFMRSVPFLVGLVSLILGDSRAYLGAFLPSSIWQAMKAKLGVYLLLILTALPPVLLLLGNAKAIAGFTPRALTDRSLGMRLDNYANFMEWLTLKRLLFGDGYAAYTDFAVQYGQPGHPDNLYIRVISEVGILGMTVYFLAVATVFWKLELRHTVLSFVFILGVLVLGLVQESHLANKSGQMLSFLVGLSFIKSRNERSV